MLGACGCSTCVRHAATFNLDETIAVAAQNLTRGPSTEVYRRHFLLNQAKSPVEKLSHIDQIEAAQPGQEGMHYLRATILRDIGKPQEAVVQLKKSIAQSPGHSESHLKLGANWSAAITSPPLTEHLKVLRAWSRSVPPDRGSGSSDGIQIRSLARRGEGHHRSL